MTYRMQGLGATPPLSDQQIGMILKAFVTSGGCKPEVVKATPCLTPPYMQILGGCFVGRTPPGLTDLEYAAACMSFAKCGFFDKMGCPGDGAELGAALPSCLNSDSQPIVDYCKGNPTFQGPNKVANDACWTLSRYPDVYAKLMGLRACPTPAPRPLEPPRIVTRPPAAPPQRAPEPPPSVAPPVYQAPPPVYQAPPPPPPVYQEPPMQTAPPPPASSGPSESTPTSVMEPLPPPVMAPPPGADDDVPVHETQKSNMMMWGLLGVAALGVGYFIFRKG